MLAERSPYSTYPFIFFLWPPLVGWVRPIFRQPSSRNVLATNTRKLCCAHQIDAVLQGFGSELLMHLTFGQPKHATKPQCPHRFDQVVVGNHVFPQISTGQVNGVLMILVDVLHITLPVMKCQVRCCRNGESRQTCANFKGEKP